MALKTGEKPLAMGSPPDTVLLELAMYTQYTWGGFTYEGGTAYKFKREDALQLMSEQDHGRPIWKQYRPAKPKGPPKTQVVDSTEMKAVRTRTSMDEAAGLRSGEPVKRIEVGTDEEISEILSRPDDESGDVTV